MREEVSNWWKQAKEDLKSAEEIFGIKRYYASAFFCQQAVEKGLKALYIQKNRQNITTHNLIEIARHVGFPEDKLHLLREINADYILARYADAANAVPAEIYDEKISKEHLAYAKEVVEWISKSLVN